MENASPAITTTGSRGCSTKSNMEQNTCLEDMETLDTIGRGWKVDQTQMEQDDEEAYDEDLARVSDFFFPLNLLVIDRCWCCCCYW